MVDEVLAPIPLISASGIATFTLTVEISRMLTTACEGMAVPPALTKRLPTIPLTGATNRQSARFFLATSNCDLAWATLLWISTHWTSGSDPLSCSILYRAKASLACVIWASAPLNRLRACVSSISAISWPRPTACPSFTSMRFTTPMPVKLTAVASHSSTIPTYVWPLAFMAVDTTSVFTLVGAFAFCSFLLVQLLTKITKSNIKILLFITKCKFLFSHFFCKGNAISVIIYVRFHRKYYQTNHIFRNRT